MPFRIRIHFPQIIGAALLCALLAGCTNYSAEQQTINPPIILSVVADNGGHLITVAAQNSELGFFGYRLYQSTSEAAVRGLNPNNGTDCGALAIVPDRAQNYVIEVRAGQVAPTAGTTDRICALPVSLTSGGFIALRALGFSVTSINTSEISNAVIVP